MAQPLLNSSPSSLKSMIFERYKIFEENQIKEKILSRFKTSGEALAFVQDPYLGPGIKKLLLSEHSWEELRDANG